MITTTSQQTIVASAKPDRWLRFLFVTVVLNLISFVFFPNFVTDAATPMQLLLCVVPASWGLYVLFAFRTRKERIVGYVSIVPAAFWGFAAASLQWENGWIWMW